MRNPFALLLGPAEQSRKPAANRPRQPSPKEGHFDFFILAGS